MKKQVPMRNINLEVIVFVMAYYLINLSNGYASSIIYNKQIEWGPIKNNGIGWYKYACHAFAEDRHDKQHKDYIDTFHNGFKVAYDIEENKEDGTIFKDEHSNYGPNNDFPQNQDLNIKQYQKSASTQPAGGHVIAVSTISFQTNVHFNQNDPNDLNLYVTGNIQAFADTNIFPPLGDLYPETAYGEALATGIMKLDSNIITAGEAGKVPNFTGGREARLVTQADTKGKAEFFDPITLAIYNAQTDELVLQSDIWNEEWIAEGDAEIKWYDNDTGFIISAGLGSSASVTLETLSSWVVNGFTGTVSIDENGVFTKTGGFLSLNWDIQIINGVTTAKLSHSQLRPEFDFEFDIPELETLTYDVYPSLIFDDSSLVHDYATVSIPEPLTIVLVISWFITLMIKKRR